LIRCRIRSIRSLAHLAFFRRVLIGAIVDDIETDTDHVTASIREVRLIEDLAIAATDLGERVRAEETEDKRRALVLWERVEIVVVEIGSITGGPPGTKTAATQAAPTSVVLAAVQVPAGAKLPVIQ